MAFVAHSAEEPVYDLELISSSPDTSITYYPERGVGVVTNGLTVLYGPSALTAERAEVDFETGSVIAQGSVFLQNGSNVWSGKRIETFFREQTVEAEDFRAGYPPYWTSGTKLEKEEGSEAYSIEKGIITVSDYQSPDYTVRTSNLRVTPGESAEARNATAYVRGVPVFYAPYFKFALDGSRPGFSATPGYRSKHGAYLLTRSGFNISPRIEGDMRVDLRSRRGVGAGPEIRYDLDERGRGDLWFYYLNDLEPYAGVFEDVDLNPNRYIVEWFHNRGIGQPNSLRVSLNRQSDTRIERDFYEGRFRRDPRPDSFLEWARNWEHGRVSALLQTQLNPFFESVERLPEIQLDLYRRRLGRTPLFYESQSQIGFYQKRFVTPGTLDYEARRADTWHQISMPTKVLPWVQWIPNVGVRGTSYSDTRGSGGGLDAIERGSFHAGADLTAKASRTWENAQLSALSIDGLRHIARPSIRYAYLTTPNADPTEIPQFDTEFANFEMPLFHFPERNTLDALDSRSEFRLELDNRWQTKRNGAVEEFASWRLASDLMLDRPDPEGSRFSDLFSTLEFRPMSGLAARSTIRYSLEDHQARLSDSRLIWAPGSRWSASLGHRYIRENDALGGAVVDGFSGANLLTSQLSYMFNDNWGLFSSFQYELKDNTLEEQAYSLAKDMRSWVSALTLRVRDQREGQTDVTFGLTFSFKAFPSVNVRQDRDQIPATLLGER